ncbi:DUF4215 domain-containing protein [Polyangium sp. y55x31]|uniref:DUF4215 domain-containing protein n=1 Tax=Polyangium sp. y55x31 TaxID=3042688 RepID=UPI00248258B7|nr:DUF4215 domain-containing protein [Polyangium sp. y55x31]MDI1484746.1 DUF4215 domain-containing protein [Polyangium sp. y55x31]
MNGTFVRICGCFLLLALLGGGCGQILGLDEYVLVDPGNGGAGGAGGSVPPACGDGILDPDETCDDGNQTDSDGCTSCAVDACYTCTGTIGTQSLCMAKTAGDLCAAGLCDGAGMCVECLVDAHCSSSAGWCDHNKCVTCTDTLKNGDETDVDCGGTHCPQCVLGKTCIAKTDCASTFCVDGVCCGEACDAACLTCIDPRRVGDCAAIDKYGEDPSYGMGDACLAAEGEACTGGTACLKALGQACTTNAECTSAHCDDPDMNGIETCVKNVGEPCTMPADCYTNKCTNGFCAM